MPLVPHVAFPDSRSIHYPFTLHPTTVLGLHFLLFVVVLLERVLILPFPREVLNFSYADEVDSIRYTFRLDFHEKGNGNLSFCFCCCFFWVILNT